MRRPSCPRPRLAAPAGRRTAGVAHNRRIGPAPADDRLDPASLAVLELCEHLSAIGADELRQIRLLDDELTGTEESVEVVASGKS